MARRTSQLAWWVLAWVMAAWVAPAWSAQPGQKPARRPAAAVAPAAAAPAATPAAAAAKPTDTAASASATYTPRGEGHGIGAVPAWVVEPPEARADAAAPAGGSRREQLIDVQINYSLPGHPSFVRQRAVALDAATLGSVSQTQIAFNPAFQRVVLHAARVFRNGRAEDRLAVARIEPMRRETQLEKQVIDGVMSLLVVLPDVRVGEPVEIAYTLEGENPIFEQRIATTLLLADETPIDLLHLRVLAPAGKTLHEKSVASDARFERRSEGAQQVFSLVRRGIAPMKAEAGVPPWHKVFPVIQLSEYRDWQEVGAWAERLFAPPAPEGELFTQRVQALRATGLQGEALVAAALRFVQDEVRYFSASLGESSHRPKAPEATLRERLGDCKDKTVLLNALLQALGFEARAALVSLQRNRGVDAFWPSHQMFDHVVTRLRLDGKTYFLDATLNGQGTQLASQGYLDYGKALVVGEASELAAAEAPDFAVNSWTFRQQWDYRDSTRPTPLQITMTARGLSAEGLRRALAMRGAKDLAEALTTVHARVYPGLRSTGEARFSDDRDTNTVEMTQAFELAAPLKYERGALMIEVGAFELVEFLQAPSEPRRQMPFLLDAPTLVTSQVEVRTPRAAPGPRKNTGATRDAHFLLDTRAEINGDLYTATRRLETQRREVLPEALGSFRENLQKARGSLAVRLDLPLVDLQAIRPELAAAERTLRESRGYQNDNLSRILMEQEFNRVIHSHTLRALDARSPVAADALAQRAISLNLLGRFQEGLADAELALKAAPGKGAALDARGVALVGLGRLDEAREAFRAMAPTPERHEALNWLGAIDLMEGRYAEAAKAWSEVVDSGDGEGRTYAMLGLFLASEHQGGGRGKEAVQAHLDSVDAKAFPGALLHFMAGRLDENGLLELARASKPMERLNLAEAYYYIGRLHAARGQADQARRWFDRAVDTQAVPQREVTLAKLEQKRRR